MPIPLVALAASAAAKTVGNLAGGIGQYNDTQKGMTAYKNLSNQGIQTLEGGKNEARDSYTPYTNAGSQGISGFSSAIQNRKNAPMANVTDNSSQNAINNYLNPSAAYTADQANKATQASALAKGGMGGGLAKALSNNANQMAMTNYNNAFNQMLQGNAQTFSQENTNYGNQTAYDQSQIGNYGNLANIGLTANNSLQSLLGQYNSGINTNYQNQGQAMNEGWKDKGAIFNKTSTSFGDNLGGGISSMFGGGK